VLGLVVTELAQPTSACAAHPTFVFRAAQDEPKAQSRTLHHRWQAKTEHHQRNGRLPEAGAATSLRKSEPVAVPSVLAARRRPPPPLPSRPGQVPSAPSL